MSDPKTIPRQVVIALATRLATIKVASGYRTNLGLQVFRRPRTMDEAETYLQSAAIWILSEAPGNRRPDPEAAEGPRTTEKSAAFTGRL